MHPLEFFGFSTQCTHYKEIELSPVVTVPSMFAKNVCFCPHYCFDMFETCLLIPRRRTRRKQAWTLINFVFCCASNIVLPYTCWNFWPKMFLALSYKCGLTAKFYQRVRRLITTVFCLKLREEQKEVSTLNPEDAKTQNKFHAFTVSPL